MIVSQFFYTYYFFKYIIKIYKNMFTFLLKL